MTLNRTNVAVLGALNRATLPDRCTVEVATKTPTATGGQIENWLPVSEALTDMPCRVSMRGAPREDRNASPREQAEYTVALDGSVPDVATIGAQHRLVCASDAQADMPWALVLYVLAVDGPQSLNPFPFVWCTTTQQPGQ